MAFIKKIITLCVLLAIAGGGYFMYWSQATIIVGDVEPIPFTIIPGSGAHAAPSGTPGEGWSCHPRTLT